MVGDKSKMWFNIETNNSQIWVKSHHLIVKKCIISVAFYKTYIPCKKNLKKLPNVPEKCMSKSFFLKV